MKDCKMPWKKKDDIEDNEETPENESGIVTTMEEMDAYYIVKAILSEHCDLNKIYYKDTMRYFGVLFDNKVTKWICRIYLKENVKFIIISDKEKNEVRYDINKINDIYKLKKQLLERLDSFVKEPVNN